MSADPEYLRTLAAGIADDKTPDSLWESLYRTRNSLSYESKREIDRLVAEIKAKKGVENK